MADDNKEGFSTAVLEPPTSQEHQPSQPTQPAAPDMVVNQSLGGSLNTIGKENGNIVVETGGGQSLMEQFDAALLKLQRVFGAGKVTVERGDDGSIIITHKGTGMTERKQLDQVV